MVPALQGLFDGMAAKPGTVLCPVCRRGIVELLALTVSVDRVTEGFDTADLKEAKVLIQEVS